MDISSVELIIGLVTGAIIVVTAFAIYHTTKDDY